MLEQIKVVRNPRQCQFDFFVGQRAGDTKDLARLALSLQPAGCALATLTMGEERPISMPRVRCRTDARKRLVDREPLGLVHRISGPTLPFPTIRRS